MGAAALQTSAERWNTANTRVFKVALPGAQSKLLGGESGSYEREEWVDHVLIASSERAIVDVRWTRDPFGADIDDGLVRRPRRARHEKA